MRPKYEIRFATDILRRLGEELNPSPDLGIIELVKNAYDADARRCTVKLSGIGKKSGKIEIEDDGVGMTPEDIAEGWLVLGQSRKTVLKRTTLGRIPAGSKGLGRLAALRLGEVAKLRTRPSSNSKVEFVLRIDWRRFDAVEHVDDVKFEINRLKRRSGLGQGSTVTISRLRDVLGRMDVKRLARSMLLLADPFGLDERGFQPRLVAPEFQDLERLVQRRYFEDAEYHLIAEIDELGRASASVVDWHGNKLYEAEHEDLAISRRAEPYQCPVGRFDLWVFILQSDVFRTRMTTLTEVRNWLTVFGGVHLYYNGLRVTPYGNEGNDWLDMNLARVRSPEERPSTNTSIGRVSIVDERGALEQKTDRSGFIESAEFDDLRGFCKDALEWMAKRRLESAEQRRRSAKASVRSREGRSRTQLHSAVQAISDRGRRQKVEQAVKKYEKVRDREVRQLHREVQLYRTLSTAGITAATFAHESAGNPIKIITQSIKAIERRGREELKARYEEVLSRPVEAIKKTTKSLAVLGSATLRLLDHDKRRAGRVDLHQVIERVLETFQPFLDGRDVHVKSRLAAAKPYLRGSEAAIESIITNLLNNSLVAFEESSRSERLVIVETSVSGSEWSLRVCDNGPGIENIELRSIWLPGETTRPNGTGLGLTIVRDAVEDLGGSVSAVAHGSELSGAEIIVNLPILGA